jgi:hypothetical protein
MVKYSVYKHEGKSPRKFKVMTGKIFGHTISSVKRMIDNCASNYKIQKFLLENIRSPNR